MKLFTYTSCFALMLLLAGCENFDYFRSEDDLNRKIQARWILVPIPKTNPVEYWTFSNGIVYRQKGESAPLYDTGTYTISADFDDAVLDIKDFKHIKDSVIAPWDIVRLDESILFIATDKNGYPGVTQKEFYK